METKHVIVVPYDPQWPAAFAAIRRELEAALGPLALAIEHVGSTAVEGLAAKPIIDIDVVIRDNAVLASSIRALASIGYRHEGDLGIEGREAFRYEGKPHLQTHHLICLPPAFRGAQTSFGVPRPSAHPPGYRPSIRRDQKTGRRPLPGRHRTVSRPQSPIHQSGLRRRHEITSFDHPKREVTHRWTSYPFVSSKAAENR